MTYQRNAKQNDRNEPEIVAAFRKMGASVAIIGRPVDLVIGYFGITRLVEVKNPETRGKLNPEQKDFIDGWRGGVVPVVESVEDAVKVLDAMRAMSLGNEEEMEG